MFDLCLFQVSKRILSTLLCRNAHSDIQMGVNGWFEQRCPLAYLGCTYSQRRFRPSTHDAYVNFK